MILLHDICTYCCIGSPYQYYDYPSFFCLFSNYLPLLSKKYCLKYYCFHGSLHVRMFPRVRYSTKIKQYLEIGLTVNVTGRQGTFTPPRHQISPLVYSGIRVSPNLWYVYLSFLRRIWLNFMALVFFPGFLHSFHNFFSRISNFFRPEYHWRDLSSRNAHLVHQDWYRISFISYRTYGIEDCSSYYPFHWWGTRVCLHTLLMFSHNQ
jgi:hypothetical protein